MLWRVGQQEDRTLGVYITMGVNHIMGNKIGKKKVTFLFGAGAETVFGLPSGKDFAKDVLLLDSTLRGQVKEFFESQECKGYKNTRLIYAASRYIYYQTICENEDAFRNAFKDMELRHSFPQIYDKYRLYKECTDDKKQKEYAAHNEEFSNMCGKVWKFLSAENAETTGSENSDLEQVEYKKLADFILNNVRYYAQIDKQFNALRNPKQKMTEYWTVLNTYAAAFFSVFNKMYRLQPIGEKRICTKKEVIELINSKWDEQPNTENYYQILKNNLEQNDYECITTNYTPYIEEILGKGAYLHGKLSWFEDNENLAVYDARKQKEAALICKNFVFPFIFIQSGIKPIVSKKQIEEFHKAITYLNKSDTLVVVGYNFNSDDNHINSMIADWLREGNERQLVFFKYIGVSDANEMKSEEELRMDLINRCQWLSGVQEKVSVIKLHGVNDFENYIKWTFSTREDSWKT